MAKFTKSFKQLENYQQKNIRGAHKVLQMIIKSSFDDVYERTVNGKREILTLSGSDSNLLRIEGDRLERAGYTLTNKGKLTDAADKRKKITDQWKAFHVDEKYIEEAIMEPPRDISKVRLSQNTINEIKRLKGIENKLRSEGKQAELKNIEDRIKAIEGRPKVMEDMRLSARHAITNIDSLNQSLEDSEDFLREPDVSADVGATNILTIALRHSDLNLENREPININIDGEMRSISSMKDWIEVLLKNPSTYGFEISSQSFSMQEIFKICDLGVKINGEDFIDFIKNSKENSIKNDAKLQQWADLAKNKDKRQIYQDAIKDTRGEKVVNAVSSALGTFCGKMVRPFVRIYQEWNEGRHLSAILMPFKQILIGIPVSLVSGVINLFNKNSQIPSDIAKACKTKGFANNFLSNFIGEALDGPTGGSIMEREKSTFNARFEFAQSTAEKARLKDIAKSVQTSKDRGSIVPEASSKRGQLKWKVSPTAKEGEQLTSKVLPKAEEGRQLRWKISSKEEGVRVSEETLLSKSSIDPHLASTAKSILNALPKSSSGFTENIAARTSALPLPQFEQDRKNDQESYKTIDSAPKNKRQPVENDATDRDKNKPK